MHGFYRLNIIRAFSITSLLLVAGSAVLVVVSNALSKGWKDQVFSSMNHVLLFAFNIHLIISELDILRNFFHKNFPLIGPQSSLLTLGTAQAILGSSLLADRTCVITPSSPPYLTNLLLSAAIISACAGLFNIIASLCFRGPGKLRLIRTYGTPVPDVEKGGKQGSDSGSYNVFSSFENAFNSGRGESRGRDIQISAPMPAYSRGG